MRWISWRVSSYDSEQYIKNLLTKLYIQDSQNLPKFFYRSACHLFPSLIARIELSQGKVSEPLSTLQNHLHKGISESELYQKLSFMQQVIKSGFPHSSVTDKRPKAFNGRVLQVFHSCDTFHPNGYAIRSKQIINSLSSAGIHTTNATRLGYPWDIKESSANRVCTESITDDIIYLHKYDARQLNRGSDLDYITQYASYLYGLISRSDSTVIHSHSNYLNGIAAALSANKSGIKSIYEIRGLWHITACVKDQNFKYSDSFKYREKMELAAAKLSDKVITLSTPLKNWLINKGIPEEKISIIPNASLEKDIQTIQNTVDKRDFVIGYIGSITEYEGLNHLLLAVDAIKQEIGKLKVIIIGDGDYKKDLKSIADKLKLNDIVEFVDRIKHDEAADYYALIDVFPLFRKPYDVCNLVPPLKLLEIMSYGKAVVVSDLPPLKEIIDHNINGIVCRNGNINELSESILRLYKNKDFALQLGRNARMKIKSTHNWSENSSLYKQIYSTNTLLS